MHLTPGTRLGPYEIVAPIGAGGMGEVYRARDTRLERDVAVKVLPAGVATDPDRRARFEREAKAVAALSHPNILAIHDVGEHGGVSYAVTELLEGRTLREWLADGPIPVRKSLAWAVQIARGLAAAHDRGIVHRDLKPENVFVLDDGHVKVLDFGLARQSAASTAAAVSPTVTAMTGPGTILGTVGYMAPEQVRGEAVDGRADLFALGAVLYEMLSGRRAFQKDTDADTLTAILRDDPPELATCVADLPPALDPIVRHCLEKSPAERFQTARDVGFALATISGASPGSGLNRGLPASNDGAAARRAASPGVLVAAVLGAILLGAAGGYVVRDRAVPPGARVADVTFQPVTFDDGFVFAARFARDGRTIVYSADWDGRPRDVYVTSIDSRESRPLGLTGSDLLALAPASGELAVLSGSAQFGNLYVRLGTLSRGSLMGGAARSELDSVQFADFAPDGRIAAVRVPPARYTLEFPPGHVLLEHPSGASTPWYRGFPGVRVSPSGTHLAVFDPKGGLRVRLLTVAGLQTAESPPVEDWWGMAWTPRGELWYGAAPTWGRQTAIYALDLEGHGRLVYRAPGTLNLQDVSPQGDVLGTFDRGRGRIEVVEPGRVEARDVTWRDGGDVGGISADGSFLFSHYGDSAGPAGTVSLWRAGAPEPVRIADGAALGLSRDGATALVSSRGENPVLRLVPTSAGEPVTLDVGPIQQLGNGGWLPDGRILLEITRPGNGPAVFAITPGVRGARRLLPEGVRLSGLNTIAPDGSRVVALDPADRPIVCVVATSACAPLSGSVPGDRAAGWTPDGQSLFVYTTGTKAATIDRVEIATGQRSVWKTLPPRLGPLVRLAVSASGAVLYNYEQVHSQLFVIRGLR